MSPNDSTDMEELDDLAAELAEAGRLARVAIVNRERPQPAFAMRLRGELLSLLPEGRGVVGAISGEAGAIGMPIPPNRPRDASDRLADRRRADRPFAGVRG